MLKATDREMNAAKNVVVALMEFLIAWEEGRQLRTPEPAVPHIEVRLPEQPAAPVTKTENPNDVQPSAENPNRLVDVNEVAEMLDCSPRHVYRMADAGRFPRPRRLGSLIRWPVGEVRKWIEDGCPRQCARR